LRLRVGAWLFWRFRLRLRVEGYRSWLLFLVLDCWPLIAWIELEESPLEPEKKSRRAITSSAP
jgi:hypothetical protein